MSAKFGQHIAAFEPVAKAMQAIDRSCPPKPGIPPLRLEYEYMLKLGDPLNNQPHLAIDIWSTCNVPAANPQPSPTESPG